MFCLQGTIHGSSLFEMKMIEMINLKDDIILYLDDLRGCVCKDYRGSEMLFRKLHSKNN